MTDTLSLLRAGKLSGIQRLDLSCGLTEFPQEIFDLADSLEILNLSGNRFTDLPDELTRLKKLRILFCSENDFRHVPPVLGDCAALSMIAFKSNRVETVAEASLPPSLRWLILTDNRIEKLPASIGKCRPLQKLMLAGNRLEALPDEMAACLNLELVRLAANRFRSLPEWLFELPRLSWLAFSGNPMGDVPQIAGEVVDWADIQLEEKLGEGASGVIHKASSGGRAVAVKLFKGAMTSDGMPASEMAACLAAGDHPNLIRIEGQIANHPDAAQGLVMEWIDGSFASLAGPPSLKSCSRDVYAEERFSPSVVQRIADGLASAAAALHAKGILHGDLYAHNVLRNAEGDCRLGDFGAASFYPARMEAFERIEVLAFGRLLEELLMRCDDRDDVLETLATRCLSERAGDRPMFGEIAAAMGALANPA